MVLSVAGVLSSAPLLRTMDDAGAGSGAAASFESILQTVVSLESELGLQPSFTAQHRADPVAKAFDWNALCPGSLLRILGRNELESSALCKSQAYRTGCSGYETVGLGLYCLKEGLRRVNIGTDMFHLAACVCALVKLRWLSGKLDTAHIPTQETWVRS